ncbi:MAG: T9SS type A sorting domain-containing protein [Flavobacteriales bacterium]|nr:T9SS type A sorting domain-containing protein [Flavobacteriales bacterium]
MKHALHLSLSVFCLILLASSAQAQPPNSGFEDWVDNGGGFLDPVDWVTSNAGLGLLSVEQYTPAMSGNYAMRVYTWDPGFGTFAGSAMARFPYTQRPDQISACIAANVMPGDKVFIIVALSAGDSIIASPTNCTFWMDTNVTQYTCLSFPITYNADLDPDTAMIIVAAGLTGSPQMGTEIIVDDISFEFNTGQADHIQAPGARSISPYPVPAADRLTIPVVLAQASRTRLELYGSAGQLVRAMDLGMLPAGRTERSIDVLELQNGVYQCVVRSSDSVQQSRITVMH